MNSAPPKQISLSNSSSPAVTAPVDLVDKVNDNTKTISETDNTKKDDTQAQAAAAKPPTTKQHVSNMDPKTIMKEAEKHFEQLKTLVESDNVRCEEFNSHVAYLREFTLTAAVTRPVRNAVADKLASLGLAKVWKSMWQKLSQKAEDEKILKEILYIMWNSTDASSLLCQDVQKNAIHIDLITYLSTPNFIPYEAEKKKQFTLFLIKGLFGILHNTIQVCDIRADLRERNAVHIAHSIRSYPDLMIQCKACILLAYIINEDESSKIDLDDKLIAFMVSIVNDSLIKPDHNSARFGFNAIESLAALNKLAVNDANKSLIVKAGALPCYVKMLQPTCTPRENILAAQGVWTLAFKCRTEIENEPGCLEALRTLAQSENEAIKKEALGALWLIENKEQQKQPVNMSNKHIMISYSWSTKPLALRIRDMLKQHGYSIWMDVDNIKAEYAYRRNTPIIPVLAETKYQADGWLGALLGNKLFFDLSRADKFDFAFQGLLRELGSKGKQMLDSQHSVEAMISSTYTNNVSSAAPRHIQSAKNSNVPAWKESEVMDWLKKTGLEKQSKSFEGFDGTMIVELREMMKIAGESYYLALRQDLHLSLREILLFTKSLREL